VDLVQPAPSPPTAADAKRVRALTAVAHARLAHAWLRIGACAIVTIVSLSVVGNLWPLGWYFGLVAVVLTDRAIFQRVLTQCEVGAPPTRLRGLVAWTLLQSIYGTSLAALLWFAPYVPGETLAALYICGGLANAAATLRASPALSMAGAGPAIAFLLGLPLADYLIGGARNPLDLLPLVAGLLLLGFGVSLWRTLLASDAAQASAEAAAMRERQAAAAAAVAKSDMVRRMNDELRTPMAALIGAAEHLRRVAATPQARAHIATLAQAGEVLKLVLDDLSDLDRLENGQLRIEPAQADPRALVRGVVSAFRAAAQDKNLELFLDIAPEAPAQATLDAARVRQVMFNLLANAVRFTAHGGVRVRLGAQPAENGRTRLTFIVADTGEGMPRAQLASILNRDRLSTEGKGPGLGLAISLRLARLMGGKISARSEPGQGSVFSFALDVSASAAAAPATSAA
jgi:signal transduction histidine kinase